MAAASSARNAGPVTRCISCWASPSVGYGDRTTYPTLLLSTLLGGGMSSRLFQEIREKRGLVYSIYSFNCPVRRMAACSASTPAPREAEAEELVPVALEELRTGCNHEVSDGGSLARARSQVKASLLMSLESTGSPLRAAGSAASGVWTHHHRRQETDRQDQRCHPVTTSSAAPRGSSARRPPWPPWDRLTGCPACRRSWQP